MIFRYTNNIIKGFDDIQGFSLKDILNNLKNLNITEEEFDRIFIEKNEEDRFHGDFCDIILIKK